jgi:hypothetical protein
MDIWDIWIKFPELTIAIVSKLNTKTNYMYGYMGHLDQISRAYNCHCSQIEYRCPIGLLKSNI